MLPTLGSQALLNSNLKSFHNKESNCSDGGFNGGGSTALPDVVLNHDSGYLL